MDSGIETVDFVKPKGLVVRIRQLRKYYGFNYNKKDVLLGLNMNVERGSIYGVLGASACGKTTLLSCIVGIVQINGGDVRVLGGKPGEKKSGVPGPKIGFMPQEASLIERFSIAENLTYFAQLCGKSRKYIKERIEHLSELLELPPSSQLAGTLSGGQMRRLSLAIALVHEPELLVLDEPTNGLDPLLRVSIWEYLLKLTKEHQTTIIMTTHYIDEARQANQIGLLRNGIFLVEDCPQRVLSRYNMDSLEDVFLHLAIKQEKCDKDDDEDNQNECYPVFDELYESKSMKKVPSPIIIWAIFCKQVVTLLRNIPGLLFIVVLPVAQTFLFYNTVGGNPRVFISIFNEELQRNATCSAIHWNDKSCDLNYLSCQYLAHLTESFNGTITLKYYSTEEEAMESVRRGWASGAFVFRPKYSESLLDRIEYESMAKSATLESSDIEVTMDRSNENIGIMIENAAMLQFMEFMKELAVRCGWNPRVFNGHLNNEDPVYGGESEHSVFTLYCIPGVIFMSLTTISVLTAGSTLVNESLEGISDRIAVCGVTKVDQYAAHMIINLLICIVQICPLVCFIVFYNFPQQGSWITFLLLMLLTGLNASITGMMLAVFFPRAKSFTHAALGVNSILFFVSGSIWPVAGINEWLRYLLYLNPSIYITESYRSVMYRGWDLDKSIVGNGFIACVGFSILNVIVIILHLHIRSKTT